MNAQVYTKLEIANEYLDAAIEFFLLKRNYFCAIHLSAAAQELLESHLPEGVVGIFERAWKAEKALLAETQTTPLSDQEANRRAKQSVNEWKNEIKHMKPGSSGALQIDPAYAAEHHIKDAIVNYGKAGLPKSPSIRRFEDCVSVYSGGSKIFRDFKSEPTATRSIFSLWG